MKGKIIRTLTVFLACFVIAVLANCVWAQDAIPQLDREKLPGRQVKVAAICIGFDGEHDVKLKLALEHLHTAGKNGVDIACLPEEFAGTEAEPIPGPTTKAVARLAKKYNMYVICPIREQAADEQYNTAVLIDRKGEVAGYYRKVFVFWGEGLHLSREGVKAFDTDFGRISILTCFDLNFAELWRQCDALDVDIVFWPSAYGGGSPLNAFATLYHYYIVPVGAGNIIDVTGKTFENLEKPNPKQFIATLDLDRAFAHYDFNRKKVEKMLAEHEGEIKVERELSDEDLAPWWLFKAIKPGVSARELLKKYEIETLREYQHRSRKQINEARKKGERI
ncbi:MAG: carbon-nitrogen hydrolase family protein [Planctomycetes bacterium]|nr:carbon-nitrogen hydrolase family protein [Planctomycetota bacterium]MBL7146060.1 carbon-nitrogen hydrolase family protein [Phycisphaerae bacterium]